MIQKLTSVNVIDNSGVRKGKCISVPSSSIGAPILLSASDVLPDSKIKKGSLVKAVLVSYKKEVFKTDGSFFSFEKNNAILINNQGLPLSKRVSGPVSHKLRKNKLLRVLFLSSVVL